MLVSVRDILCGFGMIFWWSQTGQSPSYDELAELVMVMVRKTKLEELAAENAELKRRLAAIPGTPRPRRRRMAWTSRRPVRCGARAEASPACCPDRRGVVGPGNEAGPAGQALPRGLWWLFTSALDQSKRAGGPVCRQVFDVPEMKGS